MQQWRMIISPRFIAGFHPMGPEDFAPFDGMPGLCGLARDRSSRLLWCNREYAMACEQPTERLLGTTLADIMPSKAADERTRANEYATAHNCMVEYYQVYRGARWLTRVFPLRERAFSRPGCFVIHLRTTARDVASRQRSFVETPELGQLSVLTRRELEVIYCLACAMDVKTIASTVHRSVQTINDHIKSIHRKLNISSRTQLMKLVVEKGIQGFTLEEWEIIAQVAKSLRVPRALPGAAPGMRLPPRPQL